jgi:hypothetical protein
MDDMIAGIDMEYDIGSGDQHPPPEVQNFYRLLDATKKSARWHRFDRTVVYDASYGDEIEVQLLKIVL